MLAIAVDHLSARCARKSRDSALSNAVSSISTLCSSTLSSVASCRRCACARARVETSVAPAALTHRFNPSIAVDVDCTGQDSTGTIECGSTTMSRGVKIFGCANTTAWWSSPSPLPSMWSTGPRLRRFMSIENDEMVCLRAVNWPVARCFGNDGKTFSVFPSAVAVFVAVAMLDAASSDAMSRPCSPFATAFLVALVSNGTPSRSLGVSLVEAPHSNRHRPASTPKSDTLDTADTPDMSLLRFDAPTPASASVLAPVRLSEQHADCIFAALKRESVSCSSRADMIASILLNRSQY